MTKFTSFYQVLKDMHTKETWFLFLPHGVLCNAVGRYKPERYQIFHSLVRRHVQGAMAHGGIYDGDFFVGIYCFMADEFLKSVGIWQRCGQEYDGTVLTNIVPCF